MRTAVNINNITRIQYIPESKRDNYVVTYFTNWFTGKEKRIIRYKGFEVPDFNENEFFIKNEKVWEYPKVLIEFVNKQVSYKHFRNEETALEYFKALTKDKIFTPL